MPSTLSQDITRIPKTIGFPDLTLRIIQRITYDLPLIYEWSEDPSWKSWLFFNFYHALN